MQKLSLLARLSPHEYFFVDKMATLVMRESSLSAKSSSEDQGFGYEIAEYHFGLARKALSSKEPMSR